MGGYVLLHCKFILGRNVSIGIHAIRPLVMHGWIILMTLISYIRLTVRQEMYAVCAYELAKSLMATISGSEVLGNRLTR